MKVSNYFLDKECLYSGVVEDEDINCAIFNLNKFDSSITLFKRGKFLKSYSYNKGSYSVETDLVNKYGVKTSDLDRVTYILANACLNESNKRPVYKNEDYESYKYLNQYQIDEIVNEKYKDIYENLLSLSNQDFDKSTYNVYLSGKGSCIKNMDKLCSMVCDCQVNVSYPTCLSLSNPSHVQTIGLIKLNYKKLVESIKASSVENTLDTSESKFDKFILDENELN